MMAGSAVLGTIAVCHDSEYMRFGSFNTIFYSTCFKKVLEMF
jgi:hypothetical protein